MTKQETRHWMRALCNSLRAPEYASTPFAHEGWDIVTDGCGILFVRGETFERRVVCSEMMIRSKAKRMKRVPPRARKVSLPEFTAWLDNPGRETNPRTGTTVVVGTAFGYNFDRELVHDFTADCIELFQPAELRVWLTDAGFGMRKEDRKAKILRVDGGDWQAGIMCTEWPGLHLMLL